jgi:hypothetical protein
MATGGHIKTIESHQGDLNDHSSLNSSVLHLIGQLTDNCVRQPTSVFKGRWTMPAAFVQAEQQFIPRKGLKTA